MVFLYGDDNPRERFPGVHYLLMMIWVLVFFWTHSYFGLSVSGDAVLSFQENLARYALVPYDLDYFLSWRSLTTLFLHFSWISLVLNLFLLWIVGDNVESELGHLGYFIAFFGFCFLGHLAHFLLVYASSLSSSYVIGPSAGIAGILGMYLYFFPAARLKAYIFYPPFRFKKVYLSRIWAILYWLLVPFLVYLYSLFQPPLLNKYDVPLVVHVHYGVHLGFVLVGALVGMGVHFIRGKSIVPDVPLRTASEKFLLREKQMEKKLEQIQEQANQITVLLYDHPNLGLQEYLKFSFQNPSIALEPDSQLECAYAFLDCGEYEEARQVLETYLVNYPRGPYLAEVELLLAEIYGRDPFLYEEATSLLEKALPRLEGDLEARANTTLKEIQSYFQQIQDTPLADNVPSVLLSQNINPNKPEKLADILTCFQNIPRADALKLFSQTKGILAKGISSDKALLAAKVIQQELKFPVIVVSEAKFAMLPEKIEIEKVEISKEGIRFYRGIKEMFFRKFSDIHLVCAMHYVSAGKGSSPKTQLWFDFFVFNPKIRFQLREGIFESTKLHLEQDHLSGVATREVSAKKFAQLLKKYSKNTSLNLGVCIQADRGDWSKVTFEDEESYQEYCRWLLQLQTHAKRSSPLQLASVR